MNLQLTYDGFGLNDANSAYKERLLTFTKSSLAGGAFRPHDEIGTYIVQCVNSHAALVEALEACLPRLMMDSDEEMNQARQALARAKGQS